MKLEDFAQVMQEIRDLDVSMVDYLSPRNYEIAKEEFLADARLRKPNFEYDEYDLSDREKELSEVSKRLARKNDDAFERMAQEYLSVVNMHLWTLKQMQLYRYFVKRNQSNVSEIRLRQKLLAQCNGILHHAPNETYYHWLLNDTAEAKKLFEPDPEIRQRFRELVESKWKKSLARVDLKREVYQPEEVCALANAVLQEDLGFETDFRAELNAQRKLMNINQLKHIFELPVERSNGGYTPEVVRSLVLGHETFGHIYRTAFMWLKHSELAMRLPGYEVFEEGVTMCLEQALSDNITVGIPTSVENYIINGLAYCDKLDFRDTFEKYCDYYRARMAIAELDQKTVNAIFGRVARCFRGTGDVPWTASIVYFEGPLLVWQYIERLIDQPERLWRNLFEAGKTDPTLPLHRNLLKAYGWNEDDLLPSAVV